MYGSPPRLKGSVHIALPVVTDHNGTFRARTGQGQALRKAFRMRLLEAQFMQCLVIRALQSLDALDAATAD